MDNDRAHLVVDAMNVIGSRPDGWWRDRNGAVVRFAGRLGSLARERTAPMTLVIDGFPIRALPEGDAGGVEIVYARRSGANAADDRIIEYLRAADDASSCDVVTSDRTLADRARRCGAGVRGARWLLDALDATER